MSDLAVRFARDGYDAIERDRLARGGDVTYATRLLGRRAVVLGGESGARAFYDESLVRRSDAVPAPLGRLLFGRGAVHGLDGEPHRARKQMFVAALDPDDLGGLRLLVRDRLRAAVAGWSGDELVVYDELVRIYGAAVLTWAGVEESATRTRELARDMAAIVDGFGFAPSAYVRGWRARRRVDRWAAGVIDDVRSGRRDQPEGTVVHRLARLTELDARTAGVELVNVLRPTVAVAWLGTFALLALDQAPDWRDRLSRPGASGERRAFAQEVRRTSPFVPALAGRARRVGSHEGVEIHEGDRLVLDVRGINHDPRQWSSPDQFRPERFVDHDPGPHELVPQGGGSLLGHRCPGEGVALSLLEITLETFAPVPYVVRSPTSIRIDRIPALPPDGLRVGVCRSRSADTGRPDRASNRT